MWRGGGGGGSEERRGGKYGDRQENPFMYPHSHCKLVDLVQLNGNR